MKHGRGGNPKRRTLYCESDFTKLFWRKLLDKRYCFLLIFSLFWSNEIIPLTSSDFFPFCSSNDLFFLFFFSTTKRFFFFSEVLISCQFPHSFLVLLFTLCFTSSICYSPDADPPPPAFQVHPHSKKKGSIVRRLFGPENGSKSRAILRAGWMKADKDRTIQLCDIVEVSYICISFLSVL